MPYIEVYVDDCDGDCAHANKADEAILDALKAIRSANYESAIAILGEACDDPQIKAQNAKERELSDLRKAWRACENPRPDFLTFAHHRRKLSAA